MNKRIQLIALTALAVLGTTGVVAAITYEYDNLHRLTRIAYEDASAIAYDYDAAGDRTTPVINAMPNTVYPALHVTPPNIGQVARNSDMTRYAACVPALALGMPQKETTAPRWSIRT